MGIELLIFYTILAIGVSFLCSILEAVVLSVPNTQVAVWQKELDNSKLMVILVFPFLSKIVLSATTALWVSSST